MQEDEIYRHLFEKSTQGIVLLQGGTIILVNQCFAEMLGYKIVELLEFSIEETFNLFHLQDRKPTLALYQNLLEGKVPVQSYETRFIRKHGETGWWTVTLSTIDYGGQPAVLGVFSDITDRKRSVEIIRLRLRLSECATAHTTTELMQKALDEVGELTGSPIGFYHFVDEDQNSISLQAWSTRTLVEFCEIDGERLHHPIEGAGVWVDCVRQKRPVIHNDYEALQHRKGLPDGHAEVVRELVVPTIKGEKVVAILGVGNKPSDYIEQDVGLVSYIADVI